MFTKLEQRSWLKIEAGRDKTARECYQGLVEVCGMAVLPYRTVARWVQAFRAGRQNATDQPWPGRPSTTEAQVSSVATLLETDRWWTIREFACETGLTHTTILHILKESLHMRKISSHWVPHSLTEIQKWQRYESARMHLERYKKKGDAFLHHIIALDEVWARAYESEMKRQSNESSWKTKVRQNPSNAKVTVIFTYDSAGIILTHDVPHHRTVTGQYYADFLEHHLHRAFLGENTPIILHDNARPHFADVVSQLLERWQWEVPPCDFYLIPKVKEPLRGRHFKTIPDIIDAVGRSVRTIIKTGAAKGIMRLPHRWERVLHNVGEYIEGM